MSEPSIARVHQTEALRYWRSLNAPPTHVGSRLGLSEAEVIAAWQANGDRPLALPGYPSPTRWEERTVASLVAKGLSRPAHQALVFVASEGTLTVGDVTSLVVRLCAALRANGAGPAAPVAVDATQRLESYLVVLAAMLVGAPVVRLAGFTDMDGLHAQISVAPACLTVSEYVGHLEALPEAGKTIALDDAGSPAFAEWLNDFGEEAGLPEMAVSPAATALIGFTSGSTGVPKCVRTSHEAVFRSSEVMQGLFDFRAEDIFATSTDFSALSAFRSLVTMPLLCGGRALLPSLAARVTPLAFAKECRDYGVTRLTAIPAVLRGFIAARDRLGPLPLPALATVFSGSGILDQATRDRFDLSFGVSVIDYYGGREFATAVYADPASLTTVSSGGGMPVNCLVRIVDDSGAALPQGASGEIMVHSDCLMQDPPPTDYPGWTGWFQTGDIGQLDVCGRLQVIGRCREIIKARDGTLLFPVALEAAIMAVPGVREAAVFGFTAENGVEHVIATAILDGPDPRFAERVRSHMLARCGQHQVPARVFVLDALPRVASGKIDRPALRALLGQHLMEL